MAPLRRLNLEIFGLVQGVSYRWAMQIEAERLGLRGYVRNRADGSVESVAEGDEDALRALADWSRQGPPGARVEKVSATWSEGVGEFRDFAIRRSGV